MPMPVRPRSGVLSYGGGPPSPSRIQVLDFVPGPFFALRSLLTRGARLLVNSSSIHPQGWLVHWWLLRRDGSESESSQTSLNFLRLASNLSVLKFLPSFDRVSRYATLAVIVPIDGCRANSRPLKSLDCWGRSVTRHTRRVAALARVFTTPLSLQLVRGERRWS
jgi:hypothetical protein